MWRCCSLRLVRSTLSARLSSQLNRTVNNGLIRLSVFSIFALFTLLGTNQDMMGTWQFLLGPGTEVAPYPTVVRWDGKENGGPDILLVAMFPRTARRSVMDLTMTCCPNRHCHARGQIGRGNIDIHSRKGQRCIRHECHKTFSATAGTMFYRLRASAATVVLVVVLLAHGGPVQAIVAASGVHEWTVADW